jgi:DNA-binding NarL/FixJ family response regulator
VFAELDAGAPEPAEGSPRLTSRELEVLRFVAEGWTRAEIASTLEIRESTVRSHLAHIVEKLDATT